LDLHRPANDLDCFFLADGRHLGTLGQGLIGCTFIEVVNTKSAAGISPLEPRHFLAFVRSVAPPGDADIGLVRLTGAPRPLLPVKPSASHTEKVPTAVASRCAWPDLPLQSFSREGHPESSEIPRGDLGPNPSLE
jgi:hypothetical protein